MQKKLDIISLGPGKIEQLTIEAKEALLKSRKIYTRFNTPLLEYFSKKYKKIVISFSTLYDNPALVQGNDRRRLYKKIAELVVDEALNNEGIVYALPGSAFTLEETTHLIYKIASSKRLKVNTILGISFVDTLLSSLPEKYKKDINPQSILTPANLDIPFDGYFSYIIAQTADLVRRYKAQEIRKILNRHYPPKHRFLYIYGEADFKKNCYEQKVVEFQTKTIKKMIKLFTEKNGSVFIPSLRGNAVYKPLFDKAPRYKSKNLLFLADLKFQESQALFKLKRYDKALALAQEAIRLGLGSKRKDIYFLMGICLKKCKKYKRAILELKRAEKNNVKEAQINFSLSSCYRGKGQTEQANRELEKGFIKLKKYKKRDFFC